MRTTNLTTHWHTTQFISTSLKAYLEDHGYRILDEQEEHHSNCDDVIVASKIFGKEVIEIRGTIETPEAVKETESSKRAKLFTEAMYWLSDVLLWPITFFANHYNDDKNRSLCLPDLEQYKELIEKLREYFTNNNLNLKVYLVNASGDVHITHLNLIDNKDEELDDEEND